MNLILASTSPYRKELLSRLKISFESISEQIDESPYKNQGSSPEEITRNLAKAKVEALLPEYKESIIIGSDQIVALNETIFDKSENIEKATNQLRKLRGQEHFLITSVYIYHPIKDSVLFSNTTTLKMRELSDNEILKYLKEDSPFDCAGSYKIESLGISLFENIKTSDFTSIIGLPLIELSKHLRNFKLL